MSFLERNMEMKTKLKGKYIVGFDGNDHEIILNGELVYENDKIVYVGKSYDSYVDETIDVGNSIVSPGFIDLNALGDIDHDLIHFEADKSNINNLYWSAEYYDIKGIREVMTPEEEAFKSLYAYTQLMLNGITTAMPITSTFYKRWAETYEELESAVHNAGKIGLRMYLGPSYQSATRVINSNGKMEMRFNKEEGIKGIERAIKFIKKYDGEYNGLIKGMLAPERIECQTEETLKETKKASDELNCPIKLHAAQGLFEYEEIHRRHGKTPIRFLYDIGFLGENTGIPHCNFVNGFSKVKFGKGDDLELLKKTGTTVIHCPLVLGRRGISLESFAKYKRMGINIAIGTDTFPPDIIQNIRIGSALSRLYENETEDSTYADLFRAATLGGAKMLKRDDLGKLCAGAKADIIVIDLDQYHMGVIDDPIRTLIVAGSGRDVKMSIIDGKTVLKDRKIKGVDLDYLKERGQKYYNKMKLGYIERDYQSLPQEKLFKPSFKTR